MRLERRSVADFGRQLSQFWRRVVCVCCGPLGPDTRSTAYVPVVVLLTNSTMNFRSSPHEQGDTTPQSPGWRAIGQGKPQPPQNLAKCATSKPATRPGTSSRNQWDTPSPPSNHYC